MKRREKVVMISVAICAIVIGFLLDSKTCASKGVTTQKRSTKNLESKNDLCVVNKSGSQVNAAFYTKRMKRHGDVIKLPILKSKIKRDKQASILAVARKPDVLGDKLSQAVSHVDTHNQKSVCIKRSGYDFVVSTTPYHKDEPKCLKCTVNRK